MRTFNSAVFAMLLASMAALGLPTKSGANVIGTNIIAQPVTRERIATLPKKERKEWMAYLDRSDRQKATDKQALKDEQQAAGNTHPKHAGMGRGMFALRADHPAEWFTSDEALHVAHNIITYQIADGGWSKNIDMVASPRAPGDLYDADNMNRFPDPTDFDRPVDENWHYIATLDNDSTWMQIRFLARVTTALLAAHRDADAAPIRASVERGVQYLLDSEYPNGGWPQVWPLEGGYHDAITINDDAMTHAVEILHDVSESAPDYAFLPQELKRLAGPASERGIECLLKLQIVVKGTKTVWAQQYDALTLEPTSARNYEMAALSSDESYSIAEFLMGLHNPTPAEVAAVHAAADWMTRVAIYGYRYGSGDFRADRASPDGRKLVAVAGSGPIWARYYQIGTDKPIFGDRDKTIHDDVNELSRERRNGYAWYNNAGVDVLAHYKTWAPTHPK
ncbi:MAG: pectate lyase [Terracidiphilus sp.]|jgi:PelA/Pel-15E family pectate lyase